VGWPRSSSDGTDDRTASLHGWELTFRAGQLDGTGRYWVGGRLADALTGGPLLEDPRAYDDARNASEHTARESEVTGPEWLQWTAAVTRTVGIVALSAATLGTAGLLAAGGGAATMTPAGENARAWRRPEPARSGSCRDHPLNVATWRTDVPATVAAELGLDKVMFEAADPAVFAWYVKNFGPDVNLFVDHSQIVQLECLRRGIWGTVELWGRVGSLRT
jgi:hypothetical protein